MSPGRGVDLPVPGPGRRRGGAGGLSGRARRGHTAAAGARALRRGRPRHRPHRRPARARGGRPSDRCDRREQHGSRRRRHLRHGPDRGRARDDRQVDGLGVALQRPARPADAARRAARGSLRLDGRRQLRLEEALPAGRPAGRSPRQPLPDRRTSRPPATRPAATSTAWPSRSARSPRISRTASRWCSREATSPSPCAPACPSRWCSTRSRGRAGRSSTA